MILNPKSEHTAQITTPYSQPRGGQSPRLAGLPRLNWYCGACDKLVLIASSDRYMINRYCHKCGALNKL